MGELTIINIGYKKADRTAASAEKTDKALYEVFMKTPLNH